MATELDAADIATELTALCGRDFAPLVDSLQQLKDTLITLATTAVEAVKLLSCDNIVPIYQTTFYDGTCKYSIRAVMWVFSASLIMSFFGFLMITFRSALYETNYTYTYDTGHGRNSAFHDENDDDMVGDDGQTRAGATTYAPDSVMQSFEKYENNHLHNNNTIEKY